MTVPSTTYRNDYTGSSGTLVFPYTFRILADTEIVATAQYETGDPVVLTSYTVDGVGAQGGGNITFATSPFDDTTLESLTFTRNPADTQNLDIRNQTTVPRPALEDALDRRTMVSLKQQEELDRCIKFPISDNGLLCTLPPASQRALKNMAFDVDGNVIAGESVDGIVSSAMNPVISASSLEVGRAALGVTGISYISVKDSPYLATGDGVTDDTDAIRAAYTAAIAAGQNLYFPSGTYLMNGDSSYDETIFGNLYISSQTGFTIFGDGPGSTIIKQGHQEHGGIRFAGCTDFCIRDLTIDQNGKEGFGLSFGGQYGKVLNVDIKNISHARGTDADTQGIGLILPGSTLCRFINMNIDTVSNGIYCGYSSAAPTAAPTQYHVFTNIIINGITDAFGVKLRYATECVFNALYLEESRASYLVIENSNGCRFNDFSCETAPTGAAMTDTMYIALSSSKNTAFNGVFWHHGATSITGRNLFSLGESVDTLSIRDMYILANQSIAEVITVSAATTYPAGVVVENLSMTIAGGKTVTAITLGFYNSFSGHLLAGANCKANGSQIQVTNCVCDVYVTTGSNRSIYATVGSGAAIYADTVVQTGCTKYIFDDTAEADTTPTTIFAGVHPLSVPAIKVGANQVIGARATGWTVATGTASRATFVTSTVTLEQLAQRVMALEQDLIAHGIIGA